MLAMAADGHLTTSQQQGDFTFQQPTFDLGSVIFIILFVSQSLLEVLLFLYLFLVFFSSSQMSVFYGINNLSE